MRVNRHDHLVLTVANLETTVRFYTEVLGMEAQVFEGCRQGLRYGTSKINLHLVGHEFTPRAARPTPGSADFCLIVDDTLSEVIDQLNYHGVPIVKGPVERIGAEGVIRSVYLRDPDDNLVELSNYVDS